MPGLFPHIGTFRAGGVDATAETFFMPSAGRFLRALPSKATFSGSADPAAGGVREKGSSVPGRVNL